MRKAKKQRLFDPKGNVRPVRRVPRAPRASAVSVRSTRARVTAAILGVENKFFDSSRAAAALVAPTDSAGARFDPTTLDCLNCPALGSGPQARDGRKITMESIQVSGVISVAAQTASAGADVPAKVNVYLILDTQTNAAVPASEIIFTNPGATALLAACPFHELENGKRFRTLAKATMILPIVPQAGEVASSNLVQSGSITPFDFFVPLKGLEVNFDKDETTSVIAAVRDNSIHVVAFATSITQAPLISYNARLRFRG